MADTTAINGALTGALQGTGTDPFERIFGIMQGKAEEKLTNNLKMMDLQQRQSEVDQAMAFLSKTIQNEKEFAKKVIDAL